MSRKDIKKGIEIQAKADVAKVEKLAKGLQVNKAILEGISESQEDIRETLSNVLNDMSSAEVKALYNINIAKSPFELDNTEKFVLCACLYSLICSDSQKSEIQKMFYNNFEEKMRVSERVTDFDFMLLNNIDSHTDRIVILRILCRFLFLHNCNFEFLYKENFAWLYGFVSIMDIVSVCIEIQDEYENLGIDGIVNYYNYVPSVTIQQDVKDDIISSNAVSDETQDILEEPESGDDTYDELVSIIESYICDEGVFGKKIDDAEEIMKKELVKQFPNVSTDSIISVTKIENGYIFFTTHALYLRTGRKTLKIC